jgi:hypothetical protein
MVCSPGALSELQGCVAFRRTRILILCKTYPSPSTGYVETSCVAGMEEDGALIRLYPVPFRLLDPEAQFKKWQWIEADVERTPGDRRPESHRIRADTIQCIGDRLSTRDSWAARRPWLKRIPTFSSFAELEAARLANEVSLGLISGVELLGLDITAATQPDWTTEELEKLRQSVRQGSLFAENESAAMRTLRKLPYDFHYRYRSPAGPPSTADRHKIVDWEAGALFWNLQSSHGADWESAFRNKFCDQLGGRELQLLMGTVHRFPDQWLIVSVIYPPKQPQHGLFPD